MGLFYSKTLESQFFGYVDVVYLTDPHKAQSQIGYIFTYGNTTISWKSVKQTKVATPRFSCSSVSGINKIYKPNTSYCRSMATVV